MTLEVRVPGANPTTLFIAGFWGIAAAFAAAFAAGYFWPRVMRRP